MENTANLRSDSTTEPLSGKLGDTSKGQPYDGGNMPDEEQRHYSRQDEELGSKTGTTDNTNTSNIGNTETLGNTTTNTNTNTKDIDNTTNTNTENISDSTSRAKEASGGVEPQDEIKDPEGPGPKPLATVASEHGGDAGRENEPISGNSSKDKTGASDPSSEVKGTGEEWVKTSGLQADGGDFDATKPGAGREADRLMEQKGMHTGAGSKAAGGDSHHDSSSKDSKDHHSSGDKGDKPSLGERIKAKLHKS